MKSWRSTRWACRAGAVTAPSTRPGAAGRLDRAAARSRPGVRPSARRCRTGRAGSSSASSARAASARSGSRGRSRTQRPRVFKFCFDASRLGSFKRELTLFRLLRDALGNRPDIARLHEVNLKEGPYFLESEYVEGGNLREWGETDGRLAALPLEERLRLIAEIAHGRRRGAFGRRHPQGLEAQQHPHAPGPRRPLAPDPRRFRHRGRLRTARAGAAGDHRRRVRRGRCLEPGPAGPARGCTSRRKPTSVARPPCRATSTRLGVMLYQMVIGDFDQPMRSGFRTPAGSGRAGVQQGNRRGRDFARASVLRDEAPRGRGG